MAKKNYWLNSLLFLAVLVGSSLQAKKKLDRTSIVEVNDIKPFKKLQRTHTNLLVLFAQSERDASSRFDVLVRVAEEIKGKGTIAYINCGESKETKKLCKKLKASPQPVVLKHYKDGNFNKDYDRKNTVKSMLNFLNDPTGEMPWEEEEGTDDVRHVNTNKEFVKLTTKEKKPIMIMFYAPWCGYCKKLKPDYALAASELKGEAIMAGMDVDTYEGYPIREQYNITGFPTLIYFESGEEKYRYQGKHDKDSLVEWMRNPKEPPPPPPAEKDWSEIDSEVKHLTDDTFKGFLKKKKHVLVMFYAPWCGHCKKAKPEYMDAAKHNADKHQGCLCCC
ncbi:hypothetical protein OS493_016140 [Desmophyllum pertusum]|uniref:Thioredoxin domain-containing protein n=1 Tax=Desmophyllum pertusum TaxID=174260 RepID=A0A9X0A2G3_9CNID|nr:hypothetical protein OS493_016140 [Desmophyllum pertusum]